MSSTAGRGAALLLVAALAGCAPSPPADAPKSSAAAPPPTAAAPDDPGRGGSRPGTWVRAEGERQGMPITWEYRDDYTVAPPRRLPQLAVISLARDVPYVGQRDPASQQEFDAHERQLRTALGDAAELVAVLDWHQQHDWFFYTDAAVTRARVVAALGDLRGRDVRVTLESDGQAFYSTLKQRVGTEP